MSETLTQTLARNPILAAGLAAGDALPLLDVSGSGLSKDAAVVLSELAKALFGGATSSNSSGNTNITPGVLSVRHLEVTTISGSGSTTRTMSLLTSNAPLERSVIVHRLSVPATADITIEWRNASSGGALITSMVTDGTGDDIVAEFYFDGSAWQFLRFSNPANA